MEREPSRHVLNMEDHYRGFIDGCVVVEGNMREICESATED